MRLLFCTRPDAYSLPGGDTVQLEATAAALAADFGCTVRLALEPGQIGDAPFDLAHVFNVQGTAHTLALLEELRRRRQPAVLSPIYWDLSHGEFVQALARLGVFAYRPWHRLVKRLVFGALRRSPWVPRRLAYFGGERRERARRALLLADHLLPNSQEEYRLLLRDFELPERPHTIVPNAFELAAAAPPQAHAGGPTVLCCARIEPVKNQLNLLRALSPRADIRVVLAGSGERFPRYTEAVLALARRRGNTTVFPQGLPRKRALDLYREADTHCLASLRESPGLSSLEALAAGVPAVVAQAEFCPVDTYFRPLIGRSVFLADPYSARSIRAAVLRALAAGRQEARPAALSGFTWQAAAARSFSAYEAVMSGRHR